MLAIALVPSRLDYCNSRLYGIADTDLTKRVHIQLARVASKSPRVSHILRDVQRIYSYLDLNSAKLFANALVSSLLDYCNSLLYGIADTDLTKLNLFIINWSALCQSHLLAVFHCFLAFIGYQ